MLFEDGPEIEEIEIHRKKDSLSPIQPVGLSPHIMFGISEETI
jgi:hypothetical protein